MADSLVSGLVNLGSMHESFTQTGTDGKPWLTKFKDSAVMTAVATLGLVYMWNFEEASAVLAEYFDLKDGYAKAGACIALGLATCGVSNDNDPAKAMLGEALESED